MRINNKRALASVAGAVGLVALVPAASSAAGQGTADHGVVISGGAMTGGLYPGGLPTWTFTVANHGDKKVEVSHLAVTDVAIRSAPGHTGCSTLADADLELLDPTPVDMIVEPGAASAPIVIHLQMHDDPSMACYSMAVHPTITLDVTGEDGQKTVITSPKPPKHHPGKGHHHPGKSGHGDHPAGAGVGSGQNGASGSGTSGTGSTVAGISSSTSSADAGLHDQAVDGTTGNAQADASGGQLVGSYGSKEEAERACAKVQGCTVTKQGSDSHVAKVVMWSVAALVLAAWGIAGLIWALRSRGRKRQILAV